jgi:3-deoxy-7-phosphoheptulonate synthase
MDRIREFGNTPVLAAGTERVCIGMLGDERGINPDEILMMSGVDRVVPILAPYKLASRDFQPNDTIVQVGDQAIGGKDVVFMAGPCSVESRAQTMELAAMLHEMGVRIFRGGAFKPRTSPYAFQGMGESGLQILAEVREKYGMAIVTEVMGTEEVGLVAQYADMLQIGRLLGHRRHPAAATGTWATSRPIARLTRRNSSISAAQRSGRKDCAPSDSASSGR